MADHKALVFSILQFLDRQKATLPEDLGESLEVAQQCLESVYGVSLGDSALAAQCAQPLDDIFRASQQNSTQVPVKTELTQEQKDQAEAYKSQGNDLMKQEKYQEALVCYTQAIDIDNSNAVYFCNRAAAYSKLSQHDHALNDCTRALQLDPNYSKAHGRKGLAHSALNQHAAAKECYQKAMELDPANQSYKQNLEIAEKKLSEMPVPGGPMGPMGGLNLGGMDFSALLSNPALMNMATSMLQNPQMQEMMSNMMAGAGGEAGPTNPEGMSGLLQAGQQLAQQMQQSNPDLVNQLRDQMRQQDPEDPNQPQ